jgi:hypothetical protein
MKKFISLLLVIGLAFGSMAQTATQFPLVLGDTISTSTSRDTVTKIITSTAGYSVANFEITATKISGTVSAKAYLYGSVLGVNYNLIDSSAAFANQTTNSAWFTKTPPVYNYYKVTVQDPIGGATSTQSVQVRVAYTLKKYTTN